MQHILISLFLILMLVVVDLIPSIKKKEKHALWFSVPAYSLALLINILIGFEVKINSFYLVITNLVKAVTGMK